MLDCPRLERETFLRKVVWFDELDSTNSLAIQWADRNEHPLPCLIGADQQTAGRGRGQNSWWSNAGALTFSILFNPLEHGLPLLRWSQVALATGLAVADTLEGYLPPSAVQLKWPNDVYAAGRKICGILTEVPAGKTDRLVVGIGINVNNSVQDAPAEIQQSAVSLCDILGQSISSPDELLSQFIPIWEVWINRLAREEILFPEIWKAKCYLTGHPVSVTIDPETTVGMCVGLDHDGALLLETPTGIQRILAGTVRRILPG